VQNVREQVINLFYLRGEVLLVFLNRESVDTRLVGATGDDVVTLNIFLDEMDFRVQGLDDEQLQMKLFEEV
jgi:hypothetical protein